LTVWLLHCGAKIIGYSLPPCNEKENFVLAGLEKKVTHIDGDIRDLGKLRESIDICKPDIIFHLAAQPIVLESYKTPKDTFETNVMGTLHVLEAARTCASVKAVVNVTTDKCYDNKEWAYGYREIDPLGGKDPYSASKACSELVTASYRNSFFNTDGAAVLASARAGNVIGGGDWGECRIVPDCMRALSNNEPIIIRNPLSVRPWQYVLEALRGYLQLGARMLSGGKSFEGAWNFGPGLANSKRVEEVVKTLIDLWGSGSYAISKTAQSQHEAHYLHLDISKAIQDLQWIPVLSFQETLAFTVETYKKLLEASTHVFDIMGEEVQRYCSRVTL
jgi:CDP-glucose 4,6-dehydratase